MVIDISTLIIHVVRLIILIHAWSIKLASVLFNSCIAHIFLNFFFLISITIFFLIQVRFFNSVEARVIVNCVVVINVSIKNITTCDSTLFLLFRLLLLFLSTKRSFKFFLFLLEINKSLPLFFYVFWIIPIIPIRRNGSTTFGISSRWWCALIDSGN